jgi:hypothetical protein
MTISDLFSTSFLFSIVIIIILTGAIFAYMNYKITEQDHKLSSMVSLVSVLAQNIQSVKNNLNVSQSFDPTILQYSSELIGGNNKHNSGLISVSDDEDDEEEEDELEEDELEEDELEEDELEEDELEEDELEEDELEDELEEDELEQDDEEEQDAQTNVKLLNLTLANDNVENNLQFEELNAQEIIDDSLSLNTDEIKKIHIDNNNNEGNNDGFLETEHSTLIETKENEQIINEDLHFLKNVSITDLGDMQDLLTNKSEYKKLSLNKLREVVISKGIVSDASKLKKNDILKLLGDE